MNNRIKIFDTTLRDGEQSPGFSMNLKEKLQMAHQLEALNVDIIEAGFAIASKDDFNSIREVSKILKNCTIATLCRTLQKDIDVGLEAVKYAKYPRVHTFIATSDIHMKYKLKMTPEEVLDRAVEVVKYTKKYCEDIEFSAEDATRSNVDFLARLMEKVINAGATVVNIPDTVGYTTPNEYYNFISAIKEKVSNIHKADISVHCHNDLGLAVANTLSAVNAGATQVECTINGIGERAGNAALEEIVMAINTRKDILNAYTNINTKQIMKSSKLLTKITGSYVQPNKAIVGTNAFLHESGIHQHGVMEKRSTYEIMKPEDIGLYKNNMVLGKHSGKHAFEAKAKELGYNLSKNEIEKAFDNFKALADKKKVIYDEDIEAIIAHDSFEIPVSYELERFIINTGNTITSTANITLKTKDGEVEEVSSGDGPVDAAFKTIQKIAGEKISLKEYYLKSVTGGIDAQGEAIVKINKGEKLYVGRGISTDVVEASINAYLNALNKMVYQSRGDINENDYDAKNISIS